MEKKVEIFTDGACSGNPGAGGWAAILQYGGIEKVLSGADAQTTNNRMELTAVIEGLAALKHRCDVTLYSDSKYVIDAVKNRWVYGWKAKGWKRADGKPAKNPDLWERLLSLLEMHTVHLVWVKGHAGHPQNERCDVIAVSEYRKLI